MSELPYRLESFEFAKQGQLKLAEYFLGKSNYLFALAVDFPGLYKIPMPYLALAKAELKRLGFKVESGYSERRSALGISEYRIFFLGPRKSRGTFYKASQTTKEDATSFKIRIYRY